MSVRIVLNRKGIGELLKSAEVEADLKRRADAVANAAGEGMEATSEVGSRRARASVRTATREAAMAEAEDRDLTRAIDAARN